jgi:hypothetical protein
MNPRKADVHPDGRRGRSPVPKLRSGGRRVLLGSWPRRVLAGVVVAVAVLAANSALPAAAEGAGLEPEAWCWAPSAGYATINALPPNPLPLYETATNGYVGVGGNVQKVVYQATVLRWVSGSWQVYTRSTAYYGYSVSSLGVQQWYSQSTGQPVTGMFSPSVPAQRSTQNYYRVFSQLWWISDSTHGSSYSSGYDWHKELFPGGTSYIWYDMTQGYCVY